MKVKITNLPLALRLIAPVIFIGLCVGLGIGLWIGWIAWPVQITNVDISDLKGSAQEDYIVLTAKTFAYDQNLDRARERLGELNDPNAAERVANLALIYASQNKPETEPLASLALALGSTNAGVALLAQTPVPTSVPTDMPTATLVLPPITPPTPDPNARTATPTRTITSTLTPTRTAIRRTATPTKLPAVPIIPTTLLPSSLADWPGGFKIEPANAAPGQQFWHVTRAIYCDYPETQFGCTDKSGPPLPGGPGTIGVWVRLVGGKAPLILDGKSANLEDKSSDPYCQCTYTLAFPGPTIQVASYPSDKIIGAANTCAHCGFPNQHVRYFFTFQLVTR